MSQADTKAPSVAEAAAHSSAWPFEEARKILTRLERHPKDTVIFETGYGPSGLPHIGTFGEVARTSMVRHAFRVLAGDAVKTRLIAFSDDMDGLRKVPDNVPSDQAAMALPLGNGVQWAVVEAQARPGSSIAILGPGQQGLGCVLAAKAAGADLVILVGLSRDERRLEVGRQLGADVTILADTEDVRERINAITGNQGVGAAVDTTSAPSAEMVPLMIDVVKRKEGRIVVQSIGGTVPDFPLEKVARKYITIKCCRGHSYASVELALQRIASQKYPLDLMCTHTFKLDDVDLAIKSTGGVGLPGAIHVTVKP